MHTQSRHPARLRTMIFATLRSVAEEEAPFLNSGDRLANVKVRSTTGDMYIYGSTAKTDEEPSDVVEEVYYYHGTDLVVYMLTDISNEYCRNTSTIIN